VESRAPRHHAGHTELIVEQNQIGIGARNQAAFASLEAQQASRI
jgi:hypothetical protein